MLVDIDHLAGVGRIFRPDGRYAELTLQPMPTSPIARSVHLLGLPYLVVTTDRGEDFTIELPTLADAAPLRGRPVVYLDQQAWSKLAVAQYQPDKLPAAEVDAARWLIDLAEKWVVVLPYSAGVMAETTHWADRERRRRLALTIAKLSRGWQLLDPLAIRAAEFRAVLAPDASAWIPPPVWTLAPNAALLTRGSAEARETDTDLPADMALMVAAAGATTAAFSTILDADPIARTDPIAWAAHWAELANHVRETRKPANLTALAVRGAVLSDARDELAKAALAVGRTPDGLLAWLQHESRCAIRTMPSFGLASEVMYLKIVNSTARWEPNDLADIFYLVQAAGYADAVVGERSFIDLTQQAQRRLGRPATAHKTLAALHESGVLDQARPAPPSPN
jgi:hypothetical protein